MEEENIQVVCMSCRFTMHSEEERNVHYRGQWHRYNVKRKCKGLAPASLEAFEALLAAAMPASDKPKEKQSQMFVCTLCSARYRSKTALENHFSSNKHKKAAALHAKVEDDSTFIQTLDKPTPAEATESHQEEEQEPVPIPVGECLFCGQNGFDSLELCLEHMHSVHSFFIPYLEDLCDIEGLLEYLGFKLGVGHVCLACEGIEKPFGSLQSVRNHMADKGHSMLRGDSGADDFELEQFYDFEAARERLDRYPTSINGNGELVLSDGTLLGTRELAYAYKQKTRFDTESRHQTRLAIKNGEMSDPKASKGSALISGSYAQIQKSKAGKMPARHQRHYYKHLAKRELEMGVRCNKFQKFFREQVL